MKIPGHFSAQINNNSSGDIDNEAFEQTWKTDYGLSIQEVIEFTKVFYSLCHSDVSKVVHFMPLTDLIVLLSAGADDETIKIKKYLNLFSLKSRSDWDSPPDNYSNQAWAPWRFQRQLSLVSRPIIQLDSSKNPECALVPTIIVSHVVKFLSDARQGNFDTNFFPSGSSLSKWTGVINGKQGEEFNETVAEKFMEHGWNARASLSDGELLNRTKRPEFGDVDVLAWSEEKSRVLVIECKDLSLDKTFGEIARRVANYRGEKKQNGKNDDLLKHLNRCEQIEQSLNEVSKFVGFEVKNIERTLLFSNATPLQFASIISDKNVKMMTFGEISKP